jgi:uncharacterized protein (DUF2132 family)
MFDESTGPTGRLKMLRKTPWRPYFVEALYRGEYESAKAGKIKSASSIPEKSAAKFDGSEKTAWLFPIPLPSQ